LSKSRDDPVTRHLATAFQRLIAPQPQEPLSLIEPKPESVGSDDELLHPNKQQEAHGRICRTFLFEGTWLDLVLRDCGINVFIIVGVATEIGI